MGKELFDHYEIYRKSLLDANDYLKSLDCTWDLMGKYLFRMMLLLAWTTLSGNRTLIESRGVPKKRARDECQ